MTYTHSGEGQQAATAVISRREAIARGMTARQIDHRLATRKWHVIFPAIYGTRADIGWHEELKALELWGGADACISHRAAAALPVDLDDQAILRVCEVDPRSESVGITLFVLPHRSKWHFSRQAWDRDRERENRLTGLGWRILRFSWDDLKRPVVVADEVRRSLGRHQLRLQREE